MWPSLIQKILSTKLFADLHPLMSTKWTLKRRTTMGSFQHKECVARFSAIAPMLQLTHH